MTNADKKILIDINILIAYVNESHPSHQQIVQRRVGLREEGYDLVVAPQCIYEFWVVATHPSDQNGLGLSYEEGQKLVDKLLHTFRTRYDNGRVFKEWKRLCITFQVVGRRAYGLWLVAWRHAHKVFNLLTLNPDDFKSHQSIHPIVP